MKFFGKIMPPFEKKLADKRKLSAEKKLWCVE
jgi:hypothetical protein